MDKNNFLAFSLPTEILFGPGCIKQLPGQFEKLGVSRPLLVTDKGVVQAGIVDKVLKILKKAGIRAAVFGGVEPNPKDVNVLEGVHIAREHNADCLLAVGGGSPIDCAKAIGVLMAHGGDEIKKYEGKTAATLPNPPMIAVPTTAGTGSELTFSSVITDTVSNYKMTVKSPYTAPNVAVCDPELTLTVPPAVTAATGIDALTHAIEAYTATCSNPFSDCFALYAVELIWGSLETAWREGDNLEARSNMLLGSMLAGIAFSRSDVASVHCIAESLGGLYDLPHGVCNAVFLPYVMAYSLPYCEEKYARIARAMGFDFSNQTDGARMAVEAIRVLSRAVELPAFDAFRITEDQFDRLAEMSSVNISTQSNPRPMAREDYIKVLQMCQSGEITYGEARK